MSMLIIALILVAVGFGIYYTRASDLADQSSSLHSQIQSIQANPFTVTTTSRTTITQTTTSTQTLTTTDYPIPTNVTVQFTNVDGEYQFTITAGSFKSTGSQTTQTSIQVIPVYQTEVIQISAVTTRIGGCAVGETITVILFLNGQKVASSQTNCGMDNGASINYTL